MRDHNLVSAAGKLLQKMRTNRTGWRIEELQTVAEGNGVDWRRPGSGGSHAIFSVPAYGRLSPFLQSAR
jgi:hypothetical protein